MKPVDVTENNANKLWTKLYGSKARPGQPKLKREDRVRLALDTPVFRKGTMPTFTDEIFRVDQVIKGPPVHYYLRDHKDEPIKGRVYGEELVRVREDDLTSYRIEKVIRRQKNKTLVKFIGYPDHYWINQKDFV
jgi:hypothetical protein